MKRGMGLDDLRTRILLSAICVLLWCLLVVAVS